MFVVDDLLIRPFVGLIETLHALAADERREAIENELKENRLLYEIGERNEEEYEQRRVILEEELEIAEQAQERLAGKQIEVRR